MAATARPMGRNRDPSATVRTGYPHAPVASRPAPLPAAGRARGPASPLFAVGADAGGLPRVAVFGPAGDRTDFLAYGSLFTGGVRVAMADVNGDGVPDIITGAGP